MGLLDDTAIFAAVIQHGGFSHAAKHLGLSNGLISRRIANLEADLGVSLIKRTTRQIHLTPEGELLWQHAKQIQSELNSALSVIQSFAEKPKGHIRINSPTYFGRNYLTSMLAKFMCNFKDISVDLILSNTLIDPVKENIDLVIRGIGFLHKTLTESNMKVKLLHTQKINLYASPEYLVKFGAPKTVDDLSQHRTVGYINTGDHTDTVTWPYTYKGKDHSVTTLPRFKSDDVDSTVEFCIKGWGIGRLTELLTQNLVQQNKLIPVLEQYDWGTYNLYALYPQQQSLPKRTRLLLDFISAQMACFSEFRK